MQFIEDGGYGNKFLCMYGTVFAGSGSTRLYLFKTLDLDPVWYALRPQDHITSSAPQDTRRQIQYHVSVSLYEKYNKAGL